MLASVDLVAFQIFLRCGGIVDETLLRPDLGVAAGSKTAFRGVLP